MKFACTQSDLLCQKTFFFWDVLKGGLIGLIVGLIVIVIPVDFIINNFDIYPVIQDFYFELRIGVIIFCGIIGAVFGWIRERRSWQEAGSRWDYDRKEEKVD